MKKVFPLLVLSFFVMTDSLYAYDYVKIGWYDPAGLQGRHYKVYDFSYPGIIGSGGLTRRILPGGFVSFYLSNELYFDPPVYALQTFTFTLIDEYYAKVEAFGPFTGVCYIGRVVGGSQSSFVYGGVPWDAMAIPPDTYSSTGPLRDFDFSISFGNGGNGVIFQGGGGAGSGGGSAALGSLTVDPGTPDPSTIVEAPMSQGQTTKYWSDWKVSLKPLDTTYILDLKNVTSKGSVWDISSSYDGSWYRGSGAKPIIDSVMIGFATLQAFLMAWHEFRKT